MITEILLAANADPTISVGGILHSIGGNIRVGSSDILSQKHVNTQTASFLLILR